MRGEGEWTGEVGWQRVEAHCGDRLAGLGELV